MKSSPLASRMNKYVIHLWLVFFTPLHLVRCFPRTTEQRLLDHLFHNQSADARPVINSSTVVEVEFGMELVQLLVLDERRQCITTKIWVRQVWMNELTKWDPNEWKNVNQLNVEAKDVWKPDIVLYNNADDTYGGGTEKFKTMISLYPDGLNKWLSPTTFTSTCKINVKNFPFDTQYCKLKFGSWSYDSSKLNLSRHHAPLISKQYLNSSTWEVVDIITEFNSVVYNCCPIPYQDLTFTFVFKRHPLYYVFNVIAPCVVLVSMVLFSFCLPPESGERLSLNITVLLALAVFLQFLSDTLPRNSDSTPILSVFFITMMSESATALITTILVLAIHHKGEENGASSPPSWTKKLAFLSSLEGIGWKYDHIRLQNAIKDVHYGSVHDKDTNTGSIRLLKGYEEYRRRSVDRRKSMSKPEDIIVCSLQDILKEINKIRHTMESQDKQDVIHQEWKLLAKALDRLFFLLFLVVFVISGTCTLLQVYGHAFEKTNGQF